MASNEIKITTCSNEDLPVEFQWWENRQSSIPIPIRHMGAATVGAIRQKAAAGADAREGSLRPGVLRLFINIAIIHHIIATV